MAFAKPSDYAGASFFKPAEHSTALAILIEPKSIDKNVPNEYPKGSGQVKPRDEVIADISIFNTQADLDAKKPATVLKSTKVTNGMLTSTLEKIMGGAMAATLLKIPTQKGQGWVFRDVEPNTEAIVVAYYEGREAAVAEGIAAAPGFGD